MPRHAEVLAPEGSRFLMLGNVAIARGALEYGLGFASAYPGTPSTEILEALSTAAREYGGPIVEWSVNEKVAYEEAYAAALAGVPSLAAMKHVGVNVAADPFFSSAYTGVRAAFIVVSADDPGMHSSQNEQDNRWYGLHAYIPVVEPAGVQEAREATIEAFRLSEKLKRPVMLRTTTRVSHTRAPVRVGRINPDRLASRGRFEKNPDRLTLVPAHARKLREELLSSWEKISEVFSESSLNSVEGPSDAEVLVVGVGIGYRYAAEALRLLGLKERVRLLKVQTPVPPPARLLAREASDRDAIVVVEEGDPVFENLIKQTLYDEGIRAKIIGKGSGHIPRSGELGLHEASAAIAAANGASYEPPEPAEAKLKPPPRPPALCPGCPYRSVFYALRRALGRMRARPVYSGDIGCYSLAVLPPFRMQDTLVEMGGSVGLGGGFSRVLENLVVATIGDSTFFHSGLPGLANAVYNRIPLLLLVLDNMTTAMTGHQPHPGVGLRADGSRGMRLAPENVAKALGVGFVEVVDAFNVAEVEGAVERAVEYLKSGEGPAVLVARGSCILVALREARLEGLKPPVYEVLEDRCRACGVCYNAFNCPAIQRVEDGKAWVDPLLCVGCSECEQICPFDAFKPAEDVDERWAKLMRIAVPRP